MQLFLRRAGERGRAEHGWLSSRHTFSFAEYRDPRFMGFRALRVINDDRVQAGKGFGTHPHRDMEIVSYVLEGALEHRDSLGTGSVIRPGDVQRMTAGTGVTHSEFNASKTEPVHFLQIWIIPASTGLTPSYEQKAFPDRVGRLRLVASSDGRDGSVTVHQDVAIWATVLRPGESAVHRAGSGRNTWIHLATGAATANGVALEAGDAAATGDAGEIALTATGTGAELLVFDLA